MSDDEFRDVYRRLQDYEVPEPDSQRLLKTLKPLLPTPPRRRFAAWLQLVRTQVTLLEAPFWWSSILVILISLIVVANSGGEGTTLVLLLLSPLLAAGGTAYIFRPATRTLWELEQFSRVHPVELLYARLAVILAFNIVLAVALLGIAWTQGLQMVLWRVVLLWSGPMIGLVGLALFVSIRAGMVAGSIVPLAMWGVLLLLGWQDVAVAMSNGLLLAISSSNVLLAAAGLSLIGGVALVSLSGLMVWREQPIWR